MGLARILTEENVGGLDLALRALTGTACLVALSLGLFEGLVAWFVGLVAFAGVYTSLTRHCTPYVLLGFNTLRCSNACGHKKT